MTVWSGSEATVTVDEEQEYGLELAPCKVCAQCKRNAKKYSQNFGLQEQGSFLKVALQVSNS